MVFAARTWRHGLLQVSCDLASRLGVVRKHVVVCDVVVSGSFWAGSATCQVVHSIRSTQSLDQLESLANAMLCKCIALPQQLSSGSLVCL